MVTPLLKYLLQLRVSTETLPVNELNEGETSAT